MVAHGIEGRAVCLVELVFLAEGHMAGFVPLLLQLAHLLESGVLIGSLRAQSLKAAYDFALGLEIGALYLARARTGFLFLVEEEVAGSGEAAPQGVGVFFWNGTDGLPLFLHGHEALGGGAPVGAVLESLGLFHKLLLAGEVR